MLDKFKEYNPELFAKGKRGLIYKLKINNKVCALKIKNPESKANNRIKIEGDFLKLLNKYNIGPKLIDYSDDYLLYEFVNGKTLKEFTKTKKLNKKIINEIESQCRTLDDLKINKEEFHNPVKNIIISKNKPILIDFERCRFTSRHKNLNQFKQFLRSFNSD